MIFIVIPDINEKVEWMEKDLNSVLVQSERFKREQGYLQETINVHLAI